MAQKKSAAQTSKKTTAKKTAARSAPAPYPAKKPIRREVGGAVCFVLGFIAVLGYFIREAWVIDGICLYVFKGLLGWGFLAAAPCLLLAGWTLFFHHGRPVRARLTCTALIPVLFGAIVHLFASDGTSGLNAVAVRSLYFSGINMESGGVIGGLAADLLRNALSLVGAFVLLAAGLGVAVCVAARVPVKKTVEDFRNRQYIPYEPEPEPERPVRSLQTPKNVRTVPKSESLGIDIPIEKEEPAKPAKKKSAKRARSIDIEIEEDTAPDTVFEEKSAEPDIPDMPQGLIYRGRTETKPAPRKREREPKPESVTETPAVVEIPEVGDVFPFIGKTPAVGRSVKTVIDPDAVPAIESEPVSFDMPAPEPAPAPVTKKPAHADAEVSADEIGEEIERALGEAAPGEYRFPAVELLRAGEAVTDSGREEVARNRDRLEATLHSFGIGASVTEITRGPTVTRYDLELEAGVKLNKLTNLAGDLALSLGVVNVRIAPIPDKISTVGVEVPNKVVSTVYLRDIIDSAAFRNASGKLSFAVGKDIGGNCIVGNISKMPHMLIAGTTGSGKSVCMNSLILSLLYKATPEEVRLIMIDPKMVELGIYNGIPHLYIPVVTDPKKAAGSLQWAVVEMMKRYRLFSEVGVRDLTGYNNYLRKNGQSTMPNVVIVIDELADLMMTAAKEVEESICRVAQMGRAAGMHLVIATQRPSADVITGLMKANIPSRIAFAVSSAMESRIILDNQGAEKLIGMGDMLYAPLGCGKPMRVQGAFVSDEEREEVINFIKEGAVADYDDEILRTIEKAAAEKDKDSKDSKGSDDRSESAAADSPFADCDELLPQAVEVLLDTKQASVSMLQRRLKLGYSRAARLVDQMEELGIVGPFEGSKPRQILITREQWQEMSMTGNTAVEKLINEQKDDFSEGFAE